MRCSACYADNPAYLKRCPACGEPTRALEFCSNGHVLDPGGGECAACFTKWPEVPAFDGPAVLRGVLWAEQGVFTRGLDLLPLVTLNDGEVPLSLVASPGLPIQIAPGDVSDASIKILARPAGISYCLSPRLRQEGRGSSSEYRSVDSSERIPLGDAVIRIAVFRVPRWAGSA